MRRIRALLNPRDSTGFYVLPHIVLILLVIFAFVLGAGVGGVGGYLVRDHQGFYEKKYGPGLIQTPPAYIDEPRKVAAPRLSLPATAAIDFSLFKRGNNEQSGLGACQGWTFGKLLSYAYNRLHNSHWFFSPRYLYDAVSRGTDRGSWLEQYLPVIRDQGVPRWKEMPYGPKATKAGLAPYQLEWPIPARFDSLAARHHFPSAQRDVLFSNPGAGYGGVQLIKAAIAAGDPTNLGIPIYDSFWQSDTSGHADKPAEDANGNPTENLAGYHAISLVGFDDSHSWHGKTGYFLASNQWSNLYGVGNDGVRHSTAMNGYVWISYDLVAKYGFSVSVVRL